MNSTSIFIVVSEKFYGGGHCVVEVFEKEENAEIYMEWCEKRYGGMFVILKKILQP
jgi:hypothetical protein